MRLIEQGVDRVRRKTWDSEVRDDAERELVVSAELSVPTSRQTLQWDLLLGLVLILAQDMFVKPRTG